jgi:hypothetical protein
MKTPTKSPERGLKAVATSADNTVVALRHFQRLAKDLFKQKKAEWEAEKKDLLLQIEDGQVREKCLADLVLIGGKELAAAELKTLLEAAVTEHHKPSPDNPM